MVVSEYIKCGHCRKNSGYRTDTQGRPFGWLKLYVRTPRNADGQKTAFLGNYCSVGCLAAKTLQMADDPKTAEYDIDTKWETSTQAGSQIASSAAN
jgi:hypothetical protein